MKNAIVLCSGGLDSVVAAYSIKNKYDKLKFLFFDYGQRALKEEEFCSKEIAKKLKADFVKIELKWLGEISTALLNKEVSFPETTDKDLEDGKKDIENWYVPGRNSIFIINATAFAEAESIKNKEKYDIIVGFENEGAGHFKDTTESFVKKINELSKEATEGFQVIAPLIKLDKTEVVKLGKKLKVPFELTYSCYIGSNEKLSHCGKCLNCKLRQKGFYWAGVEDNSLYQ